MIGIVLPYGDAPRLYQVWAHEENSINFRKEPERAARCTISFAAEELCQYLNRIGLAARVTEEETEAKSESCISLFGKPGDGQAFTISSEGSNVTIAGEGRNGVLYGVYEFLEAQGIRWYSPWEEYVPEHVSEMKVPECRRYMPSMPLGRGFDFEGPLKESELLYLWMARNKLNVSTCRSNTAHFQKKLGMNFKIGGHIFEKMLDPNQSLPTGRTMLEEHPEWYGTAEEPLTAKNALMTQFCVSNPELREYLWAKLLRLLKEDWYDADRVDIWGFDTWGNICKCEKCTALGNGADQMLYFLSFLRGQVDKAILSGELDRPIRLIMCSYEGTSTIEPPLHGVPENLRDSGDYVVFYPILRCYEHEISDKSCSYNRKYQELLEKWQDIPLMVGEYYNVSKFEDLPLVFMDKIPKDLRNYAACGVTGMTYMHLPMVEWGVRTLTQVLYARLSWNVQEDVELTIEKYFHDLYGAFAKNAQEAYELMEDAFAKCSSWRSWSKRSLQFNLLDWDGRKPETPLYQDEHLNGNAIEIGRYAIRLLKHAKTLMQEIRIESDLDYAKSYESKVEIAINPTDAVFKAQKRNFLSDRASQDIRGLQYGIDHMQLLVAFTEYHEGLRKKEDTEDLWKEIEKLCNRTREYCYAIKYQHPRPELNLVDTLERADLKNLYYRCLSARLKAQSMEE